MRAKNRMETSKKILFGSWVVFLTILGLCVFFKLRGEDTTDFVTLAGYSAAEITGAHGFYYWKAKNENRAKGLQTMVQNMAEKYDIETAARFAEIVFKD